jgi:spore coat polysaccharide biosynthesis protein SpsF
MKTCPQMKVVASIEARLGSSRLPAKVLADICGRPALGRLVDRLRECRMIDDIVLATSISPRDHPLEAWGKSEGLAVYRGSEDDVLERVVGAHRFMGSDVVVEVTGDCPLLDPDVIDLGVETFFANDCDVVTNTRVPSFPQGADVQVFRLEALADVEARISDPAVREHVSLYFYETPSEYRIIHLIANRLQHRPGLRLQLDYAEDLAFVREVYRRLLPLHGAIFGVREILQLLEHEPHLCSINANCVEKLLR